MFLLPDATTQVFIMELRLILFFFSLVSEIYPKENLQELVTGLFF